MAVALSTLLDIETEVETVFAGYLVTTLGLPAIPSDTDASVVTPRVEVAATVTDQPTHQYKIPSGTYANRQIYDFFRVRVELRLVYAPSFAQGQGALRGKMRKALTDLAGIQAGFATHNYVFMANDTYRPLMGGRTVDSSLKEETITQSVDVIIALNPAQLATAT